MNYIPGDINDYLQKEHYFLINQDFSWINCGSKRYNKMSDSKDWHETETIKLKKDDIIVVRFFEPSRSCPTLYTYLERVIYNNDDVINYKKETIISYALIQGLKDPLQGNSVFNDLTKLFERDKKIESILC